MRLRLPQAKAEGTQVQARTIPVKLTQFPGGEFVGTYRVTVVAG